MLKKDSAGIRGQGPKRPRRVQSDADLCGGMDRVGIEGLGALGLLAVEVLFDDVLFFLSLFFSPSHLQVWIWVLEIPNVARSLMLIVGIGMLVISSRLDT
jgi:hypothetical protein